MPIRMRTTKGVSHAFRQGHFSASRPESGDSSWIRSREFRQGAFELLALIGWPLSAGSFQKTLCDTKEHRPQLIISFGDRHRGKALDCLIERLCAT